MAAIGIVVAWFGYAAFYYGFNQITGGNDSFVSLIWPGKYNPGTPRDGGQLPAGSQVAAGVNPTYDPSLGAYVGTLPSTGGTIITEPGLPPVGINGPLGSKPL